MPSHRGKSASFRDEAAEAAMAPRIPPHSIEAEAGVLGSVLLDAGRVLDLCLEGQLVPESFWFKPHAVLYEAFLRMQAESQPIDLLTVLEFLKINRLIEEIGGSELLERLHQSTPTAAHAPTYIDIVRQRHLLRRIIDAANMAQAKCYNPLQGADLILNETEQDFLSISENQKSDTMPWAEAIKGTIVRIEGIFEGGMASISGFPTGFANLDSRMYGLRNGEMIVLAARPSMGKTSLAMNICERVALGETRDRTPRAVGVFSCEMSQEALALRMLCARANVSSKALQKGLVNPAEATRKLTEAASVLQKAQIYVDDAAGLDVLDLRARARRMRKKHNVELIMIDYLQLLNSREYARQGRQLETSNISANIKAMAKELNVPVLVLSQLSRAPEQRDKSGAPKLSDLRDSGAIEQDADVVLLLRRPKMIKGSDEAHDETLAIVDVAKHRNGPTGEVRLNFFDEFTTFTDRASDHMDVSGDLTPDLEPALP